MGMLVVQDLCANVNKESNFPEKYKSGSVFNHWKS
jgi:hypothetical protein